MGSGGNPMAFESKRETGPDFRPSVYWHLDGKEFL